MTIATATAITIDDSDGDGHSHSHRHINSSRAEATLLEPAFSHPPTTAFSHPPTTPTINNAQKLPGSGCTSSTSPVGSSWNVTPPTRWDSSVQHVLDDEWAGSRRNAHAMRASGVGGACPCACVCAQFRLGVLSARYWSASQRSGEMFARTSYMHAKMPRDSVAYFSRDRGLKIRACDGEKGIGSRARSQGKEERGRDHGGGARLRGKTEHGEFEVILMGIAPAKV